MKLYYEKEGRKMKNIIKVEYMYTNAMRVIVTIIILATYNAKIEIFGIYILLLIIFGRDNYKVNYDKKIFPIINVIMGYAMYAGMLYVIFPKTKDEDSIFWLIVGILALKNIYVPTYKVEQMCFYNTFYSF